MTHAHKHRKRKARFQRRTLPGAPPGILVPDPAGPRPIVQVMAYGPEGCVEEQISDPRAIRDHLEKWPITWVNVDGLGETAMIHEIGKLFGFHRLALEDVVHVHQRAKVEQYGECLFIVARMPTPDPDMGTEQLSMFVGPKFVVTFQERPGGDCLDPVRLRIRTGVGRIRAAGPDHLAYALLDTIIDHYFPLLEACGDRLEALEDVVLTSPDHGAMARLHAIKRDLVTLRRAVWPLRDALNTLLRDAHPLFSPDTSIYLRDCHDHTIQIIDLLESYRDIASGLTEVCLSSLSNRTNEIMKVLTIIATIFIPLGFIAGLYGMNFNTAKSPVNMPELNWPFGYPFALTVMAAVAGGLLLFFRRKGWLGSGQRPGPQASSSAAPADSGIL